MHTRNEYIRLSNPQKASLHPRGAKIRGCCAADPEGAPDHKNVIGLGQINPSPDPGAPGGDGSDGTPFNVVASSVTASIAGVPAEVLSAVLDGVNGYRVRLGVPEPLTPGVYGIVIQCGDGASQPQVVIPVASLWQLGQTATIDASGGTVGFGALTVSVPANSFSAPTTLSIYQKAADAASGSTDYFAIAGIPLTDRGPMTLTFDGASSAQPMVEVLNLLEFGDGAHLFPATLTNGQATITLPDSSQTDPASASLVRLRHAAGRIRPRDTVPTDSATLQVWVVFDGTYVQLGDCAGNQPGSPIFSIDFPPGFNSNYASFIGQTLLQACKQLEDLDIGGLPWKQRNWPMQVDIGTFTAKDADIWALEGSTYWGKADQDIDVNIAHLQSDADLAIQKPTVGHELFHVLQNLYDAHTGHQIATTELPGWLWYDEAASTWFERVVAGDTWIPTTVKADIALGLDQSSNYGLIANGLGRTYTTVDGKFMPLSRGSVQDVGYAASMFLQYLTQSGKLTDVGAQFKSNATGDGFSEAVSPLQSLANYYGDNLGPKFAAYVDQFTMGGLYTSTDPNFKPFPDPNAILGLKKDQLTLRTTASRSRVFQGTGILLSANYYLVSFAGMQSLAGSNYQIALTAPDPVSLSVYAVSGQSSSRTISRIATGVKTYTTDDVGNLANGNTTLVLVVVNTASQGNDAPFSLSVQPSTPAPPPGSNFFNPKYVEINFGIGCKSGAATRDCSVDFDNSPSDTDTPGQINWTNNHFLATGTYHQTIAALSRTFKVEGDLDAGRSHITNLAITDTEIWTLDSGITYTEVVNATMTNLLGTDSGWPPASGWANDIHFQWDQFNGAGQLAVTLNESDNVQWGNAQPQPTGIQVRFFTTN
jgi:hypothetical protein